MSKILPAWWLSRWLWLCLVLLSAPAQALLLSPQMGVHEPASLVGHLSVLRDAGGQLGIEDVAEPGKGHAFLPLPGFLNEGYKADTYWLRFDLQRTAEAPEAWLLQVSPPFLNDVTLFAPRADGGFEATRLGTLLPFAQRPVPYRSAVFPVLLSGEQSQTLYLRIKTTSAMTAELVAWQSSGLLAHAQAEVSLYSVYFGVLGLGFLFNLMVWFWLREPIYLIYCGYIAALAAVMINAAGFASQWLLPHQPLLANRLVGVSTSIVFLLGAVFFIGVLRLREHFPKLNRLFDFVLIFYAVCTIAAALGWYGQVVPWLMLMVLSVTAGLVLASLWLLWHGHREYLFYILAFAVNFVSVPFFVAKLMGWLPVTFPIDYLTLLGSVMHIVLLNIAVIDRMRKTEKKMLAAVKSTAMLTAERRTVEQQQKFVAMVSHEFRTPLAVIDATAQSVEIASTSSTLVSREFIVPRQAKIRLAVRRMVSLLDNLLTSERLNSLESKNCREVVDLCDLASEAARNWSFLLQTPGQLALVLADAPVPVLIERAIVTLALSNLIDNAIKYSPSGSPVTLRVGSTDEHGWIEVEDSGPGIGCDEMALIFDKFYRSAAAQKMPGAGLGLYLVRSIARAQQGEVEVKSAVGQGSCFRLRLPLVL